MLTLENSRITAGLGIPSPCMKFVVCCKGEAVLARIIVFLLCLFLLAPASMFAQQPRAENFFPISVWYGGGKARAPMLERDPLMKVDAWRKDIAQIKKLGFNVIRVPMPGPIFDGKDVFRSYTNSLTVNGAAITPRYVTPGGSDIADRAGRYFDSSFRSKYEREVQGVYESYGYDFHWVDSDGMIYVGGAVHCTTMQVPR